jgi:hypothetical protein
MSWEFYSTHLPARRYLTLLLVAVSVLFIVSNNPGLAQTAKPLSADLLKHLNEDQFIEIHSVTEFPDSVKVYFARLTKSDITKVFANPDQNWQAGCSRTPNGPPTRRFVLGAKSKFLCLIYYELGGIVLLDKAELYKVDDTEKGCVWSSSMFRDHPKTLEQLMKSVKERAAGAQK